MNDPIREAYDREVARQLAAVDDPCPIPEVECGRCHGTGFLSAPFYTDSKACPSPTCTARARRVWWDENGAAVEEARRQARSAARRARRTVSNLTAAYRSDLDRPEWSAATETNEEGGR